jgi:hypothetical protein
MASGFAPLLARMGMARKLRGMGIFDHLAGGLSAGLFGAAAWYFLGFYGVRFLGMPPDMYIAGAWGIFLWGLAHGLLVWGIPRDLYAAWVRVLSPHRFGHRIPIDRLDGKASERFLGHYPRGLDMYLPADKGVAELHVSFVSDGEQNYALRGLSQVHLQVKRPLEAIDLRYDPRRPAPLEAELEPEDRIFLGSGAAQTELEFVLLPKEES